MTTRSVVPALLLLVLAAASFLTLTTSSPPPTPPIKLTPALRAKLLAAGSSHPSGNAHGHKPHAHGPVRAEHIARRTKFPPRAGVQRLSPSAFLVQTTRNYISAVRFAIRGSDPKNASAVFTKLAKKYSEKVFFGEVIVKAENLFEECSQFTYQGVPAIVIFRLGVWQGEVRGADAVLNEARLDSVIAGHLSLYNAPTLPDFHHDHVLQRFVDSHEQLKRPYAVLLSDPTWSKDKPHPIQDSFKIAAIALYDQLALPLSYAVVHSKELLGQALRGGGAGSDPGTIIYMVKPPGKSGDKPTVVPFTPTFADPIETERFLFLNSIPKVWHLVPDTGRFYSAGKPVLALFTASPHRFDPDMLRVLRKVGGRFGDQFLYVTADLQETRFFASLSKRDKKRLHSGFAIISSGKLGTNMRRYVFGGEKNEDGVSQWASMFLRGELDVVPETPRHTGNEERSPATFSAHPKGRPGHDLIHDITERNWNAHVLDGEKDVLVIQYAGDCGACLAFEPIVRDVAVTLGHVPSVKFVSINLDTENVPDPFRARKIPFVLLFPANRKSRPVAFRMRRMKRHSLLRFIKRNAAIHFRARNRDVEVFYARMLTFSIIWLLLTGVFLKKTKRAHLFLSRIENKLEAIDKKF